MPARLLDDLMQYVQRSEIALARALATGPQTSIDPWDHVMTTHPVM
jgi:hypothetical protein